MKILILIPIYKRPEVLKICLKGLEWFISKVSWSVEVVCILSPEDRYITENQKLIKKYKFTAVYFKNEPVTDKINAGIAWVIRYRDFDYLMNFGSDDLIHPQIEQLYAAEIKKQTKFFGINMLYFYELQTKKTIFFYNYNYCGSIGAGRMIHRSVLDRFSGQGIPLYEPGINQGMDTCSAMSIKRITGIVDIILNPSTFPYIVDIKTTTNVNLMQEIEQRTQYVVPCDNDFLKSYFPVL